MTKKMMIILFLCGLEVCWGRLLKDDHLSSGHRSYSWKEVCRTMAATPAPLIEKKGLTKLDCMGKTVRVSSFCEKKEASNPFYTRAVVISYDQTVRCYSGKKVTVKWECDSQNDFFCKDKEIGCFHFKEKLASRLELVHSSIIDEKNNKKTLNCHFRTQQDRLSINL